MRWIWVLSVLAACGSDDGGSDCPAYANIVGGTFARAGAMTTWTMELEELPATLPFDKTDVPSNILEYRWAVDFDTNNDGTTDLQASASHYKMSNAVEMEQSILMGTQQDLWTVTGPAGSVSGDVMMTVAGNVITFVVEDAEDPMLPMLTSASQGTLKTFVQLGAALSNQCKDERGVAQR